MQGSRSDRELRMSHPLPFVALLFGGCATSTVQVDRTPPPPSTAAVHFVAVGDVGKANATQHAVADAIGTVCAHQPCDFALLLGDNLYPRGMDADDDPRMDAAFTDVYSDLDLAFKVVLGNHDYGHGEWARAERQLRYAQRTPQFVLPDRYYSFATPDADFFALDTDAVFFGSPIEQGAWLDGQIDASTARWRVAFGHHPYRSNGRHGNAGQYEGWAYVPWLSGNTLFALFRNHVHGQVDLYLAGHEHNLQVMRHDGLPLVVSGAGSSARELVDRGNVTDQEVAVPGFAWIRLGERMTIRLYDEHATLLGETTYAHPRAP